MLVVTIDICPNDNFTHKKVVIQKMSGITLIIDLTEMKVKTDGK